MVTRQMNVLVTGATSGIGRICARELHKEGHRVFAGHRGDPVQEGHVGLRLDITDPDEIAAAVTSVEEALEGEPLHGLVNCAGVGGGGPVEYTPMADFRAVMEVNFFAQIAMTQAFLPLIRRGPGRIVNVSSAGGRFAGPFMAPYHASKWALEAASDSLREEVRPWGIHVALVEPGAVKTPIWTKGEQHVVALKSTMPAQAWHRYGERIEAFALTFGENRTKGIEAEVVAKAVRHALTAGRPRTRYLVGNDARAVSLAKWILPDRWFDWLLRNVR